HRMERVEEKMGLKLRSKHIQFGACEPGLQLGFANASCSQIPIVEDGVQYADKQREHQEIWGQRADSAMPPCATTKYCLAHPWSVNSDDSATVQRAERCCA